jgi:subtilase family serine protease
MRELDAAAGSGSKTTPTTSPYLTSGGGASRRGAASLGLAFAAVALYATSTV